MARRQLLALGFSSKGIETRLKRGRLHPVARGIYAVGRAELTPKGRWMAAVLTCGPAACLSHRSAGALYGICEERNGVPEVSVRQSGKIERPGIATELPTKDLLRVINEADKLDVVHADDLRLALDSYAGVPGTKRLVALLDRDTFVLTQEELERLFLPLARDAGLPLPMTEQIINGYEVDFFWPDLKLVVETDGLRYHRTPSAQAKDARRDQAHTAAGYARLRFSHHQVKHEPAYVKKILSETHARLVQRG